MKIAVLGAGIGIFNHFIQKIPIDGLHKLNFQPAFVPQNTVWSMVLM